ncbi:tRNA binding domain protein [Novymonas esmeraldas]|uniref:tRNA binding domain protein n=1 Tax=Novymonas esmeraldas TaxID=1808958 RepID=A0AAW0ER73_9TRYP
MPVWVCPECEYENEAEDAACAACEADCPATTGAAANANDADDDAYAHIHVGVIVECEDAPNTKLKRLKVHVGQGEPIPVVTAATNVKQGDHVVVACVGAEVKGETVSKTTVKGFPSQGMLCDAGMLGWVGGGAGAAVTLPDTFTAGARPPSSRPRGNAA